MRKREREKTIEKHLPSCLASIEVWIVERERVNINFCTSNLMERNVLSHADNEETCFNILLIKSFEN